MIVDGVDYVLMGPFICGDEAKIVSIGKGNNILFVDVISKLVLTPLEEYTDGIENHEEEDRTKRIALKILF